MNNWRLVELALFIAILFAMWQMIGDRIVAFVNSQNEIRVAERAQLPKGGVVARESRNPMLWIPYKWRNSHNDSPLLLPDITPIIGEDPTITKQYPNMEQWVIDTISQPGRTLLRINTITANIGEGPLHIVGADVSENGTHQSVYQRIWRSDDTFIDQEAGRFVYHEGHNHIHFDNYAQYMLRLHDADGEVVAQGNKIGFCLTDVILADQEIFDASTVRISLPPMECGDREQGINAGYSDYYGHRLAEQWIDITNLPWGEYQLQIVVDPNNLILESNEENNRLSMPFIYTAETTAERQFNELP